MGRIGHLRCNKSALVLVLFASARVAAGAESGGNPAIGQQQSEQERCQECHGAVGLSSNEKIPHHAGQIAGYLIKQLRDFQSGARHHEVMNLMAEDLADADVANIAAYFASQPVMPGDAAGSKENTLAENLFVNGDPSRALPACASCHGENGKGRVANQLFYPVIGGQRSVYLRGQLVSWKLGERNNSPDGVMNKVAKALSDEEIDALADYISGL
ncbi:MAG: c-type cytochrome [Methylobacter sp.]